MSKPKMQPLDVIIRFRSSPFWDKFFSIEGNNVIYKSYQQTFNNKISEKERKVKFSNVFGPDISQNKLYESIGKTLLKNFFNGENGLVFAYGITGSGKTYSVEGDNGNEGILPRLLSDVLTNYEKNDEDYNEKGDVVISYAEIYQEKAYDLFSAEKDSLKPLKVVTQNGESTISNLTHIKISDIKNALKIYEKGNKTKHLSSTSFNSRSSRSHTIFTIKFVPKIFDCTSSDPQNTRHFSSICVADLAGAEKSTDLNQTNSQNIDSDQINNENANPESLFDESTKINGSLLVLGKVLTDLRWNQQNSKKLQRVISWRGTTITRLLQNYLIGGGKCFMVVCVWVTPETLNPTLRVMEYGSIASSISTEQKTKNSKITKNIEKLVEEKFSAETKMLIKHGICSEKMFERVQEKIPSVLIQVLNFNHAKYQRSLNFINRRNKERLKMERKLVWNCALKQIVKMSRKYFLYKKSRKEKMKRINEKYDNKVNAEKYKNSSFKMVINELEEKVLVHKLEIQKLLKENSSLKRQTRRLSRSSNGIIKEENVIKSANTVKKEKFQLRVKRKKSIKSVRHKRLTERLIKKENAAKQAKNEIVSGLIKRDKFEFKKATLSKDGFYSVTVQTLKRILRNLDLRVGGVKADLIDRLWGAVSSDNNGDKKDIVVKMMDEDIRKGRGRQRK